MKMQFLLFILLIGLTGCLQAPPAPTNLTSENTFGPNNKNPNDPNQSSFSDTHWFDQGRQLASLTLGVDNKKVGYLRGTPVDEFLKITENYNQTYCLVINFNSVPGNSVYQMRVRAIAQNVRYFTTGIVNRFFKLNLDEPAGNNICNQAIETANLYDPPPLNIAYHPGQVCPTCLNIINSSEIKIYKLAPSINVVGQSTLQNISADLALSTLNFRVDMNSNSSNEVTTTCSQSACQAQGYDCCVNSQCVKEKEIKPAGVSADPSGYALAEALKLEDPNWYLNYPQFYYSCLEHAPNNGDSNVGGTPDPVDPSGAAQILLQEMQADYLCLEELAANAYDSPFHYDPINTGATYTQCDISDSSQVLYYENVMKRLYQNCGCSESVLSQMVANCPTYSYQPNMVEGVLASFSCIAPTTDDTNLPFQNLNISLNNKSAPHRFFNEDNTELFINGNNSPSASTIQEGVKFQYLDEEKLFPENGQFNMNSVLGENDTLFRTGYPC
jgi:hypothetical protein